MQRQQRQKPCRVGKIAAAIEGLIAAKHSAEDIGQEVGHIEEQIFAAEGHRDAYCQATSAEGALLQLALVREHAAPLETDDPEEYQAIGRLIDSIARFIEAEVGPTRNRKVRQYYLAMR